MSHTRLSLWAAVAATALWASLALADGIEYETDRPGSDYKSFEVPSADYVQCHVACRDDETCKAWTYVKSGPNTPTPLCFLKNAVPDAVKNDCCTSGVK
jgi:hypothetical protein